MGQIDYQNPLELVKPFRIEERELSWLTDDQVSVLLEAIRQHSDNPHVVADHAVLLGHGGAMI